MFFIFQLDLNDLLTGFQNCIREKKYRNSDVINEIVLNNEEELII